MPLITNQDATTSSSVRSNYGAAHPLNTAAMPFCRKLPFFGCPRRTRFEAGLGFFRGLPDESDEAIQGILSIPFLDAEPLGLNDQNALVVDSSARQPNQTGTHVVRQIWGIPHIKAKLDGRGDFVYLLAARSGGPDEIESNLTNTHQPTHPVRQNCLQQSYST